MLNHNVSADATRILKSNGFHSMEDLLYLDAENLDKLGLLMADRLKLSACLKTFNLPINDTSSSSRQAIL